MIVNREKIKSNCFPTESCPMTSPTPTSAPALAPGLFVTISILLLASATIMANATISPSLPGLRAHFANVPGIDTLSAMLVTMPSLAILLTAGLMGWLADRIDRQWLLAVSGLMYVVGGTSGLWADGIVAMLIGRVILGVGVAGTMTLAMTWGADLWQGEARARFLGRQGAAMSMGGIVVMLGGGALASLHWRGAFAVYALVLPITLMALAALAPYARARVAQRAAGHSAGSPADRFPWKAYAIVGPMAFVFMAAFYVVPTRGAFLMSERGVTNPLLIGAIMASMTLAAIPGALFYGQLRRFLSAMTIFALSYGIMGIGLTVLALAQGPWTMLLGTLIMGVGMGPSLPNYTTWFMAFVPPSLRGRASGLLTTAFFAGQFASPLVVAPLVTAFGLAIAFEVLGVTMVVFGVLMGIVALRGSRSPVIA